MRNPTKIAVPGPVVWFVPAKRIPLQQQEFEILREWSEVVVSRLQAQGRVVIQLTRPSGLLIGAFPACAPANQNNVVVVS